MKKGSFITLYGINNIGKSTQAKILVDRLKENGYDAIYLKYPIYDQEPTGVFLNNTLRNSQGVQKITEDELQMWFTLNRYQFEPTLKRYLLEGKIVVAEDYTSTGLAWGSAKGLSLDWLIEMNKYLLKEDLAIFLKGKRHLGAREANHLHENDDEMAETCKFIFENLATKFGWENVNVTNSIEGTAEDIWKVVEKHLNDKKN